MYWVVVGDSGAVGVVFWGRSIRVVGGLDVRRAGKKDSR